MVLAFAPAMRCLLVITAAAALSTRPRGAARRRSTAKDGTLFSRGAYFAARAREDAVRAAKRVVLGDALSQLVPGGPRGVAPGSVVAVTGATSGVGKALAEELAQLGYGVVVCGRDEEKVKETVRSAARRAANPDLVSGATFDLESLASTRAGAAAVAAAARGPLEGLVLNAGCWPTTLRLTEDELEVALQTNHVAQHLLFRELAKTEESLTRVVSLSSSAHASTRKDALDLDDAKEWTARAFDPLENYSQTKLMNALFARELKNRHPSVDCVACHPGVVDTGLFRDFDGLSFLERPPDPFGVLPDVDETLETLLKGASGALQVAMDSPLGSLAPFKKPRDAARDVAAGLLSPSVESGAYYSDGEPTEACAAVTAEAARALWDWTEATVDEALAYADEEAAA